jgi:hypothetical protein
MLLERFEDMLIWVQDYIPNIEAANATGKI